MKLDERIIKDRTYLDCFDTKLAKEFIGKECYLTDGVASFANVDNLNRAVLTEIDDEDYHPYKLENTRWKYASPFILPCEWVKPEEPEKKYRPYTIKDFEKAFLNDEFDDFIIFRDKDYPDNIYTMRYNGNFKKGEFEYICLGAKNFSFEHLFENYEVADYDGDWQPFGVIDEQGAGE